MVLTIGVAADDINKLLKEVGATADKDSLTHMLAALKGKKLHDLCKAGQPKLASVPAVSGMIYEPTLVV